MCTFFCWAGRVKGQSLEGIGVGWGWFKGCFDSGHFYFTPVPQMAYTMAWILYGEDTKSNLWSNSSRASENIPMLKPSSPLGWDSEVEPLGGNQVMRAEPPCKASVLFYKRPYGASCPFHYVRMQQEVGNLQLARECTPESDHAGALDSMLILDLQTPELWGIHYCCL